MDKIRWLLSWILRGPASVWIVQHTESPHNTVLGVFSDRQAAADLADRVSGQFAGGVSYAEYRVGYQFDEGSRRYQGPSS